jgi:hypothetical protein
VAAAAVVEKTRAMGKERRREGPAGGHSMKKQRRRCTGIMVENEYDLLLRGTEEMLSSKRELVPYLSNPHHSFTLQKYKLAIPTSMHSLEEKTDQ